MAIDLKDYVGINKYTHLAVTNIKKYQEMDTELLRKELASLKDKCLKMRLPFRDIDSNLPFNAYGIKGILIKRGNRLFELGYDGEVEYASNSISDYYTITYADIAKKILEIEKILYFKEQNITGGSPLCKHEMQGVDPVCIYCGAVKW